jgi:NADH dehydrogenase [ubiquinone] 1 alpha subcomplex assembly factor 7
VTPLEIEIRRIIAVDGPISIARYMALALTHPAHGYYATRDPFGARGDFVTAPEISQMFGELLGLWAAAVWQRMGAPARVNLVELGPGRGTLMTDALRALMVVPAFRAAIEVHLVEASPFLRANQQEVLGVLGIPVAWHGNVDEVPDGPLIVLANEFFDALPVHQAVKASDGWHERMVGLDDEDRLVFALHPVPVRGLDGLLPPRIRAAPVGALFEWHPDQVVSELAARLMRNSGAALIVDYGHLESGIGDTLQAVTAHGFAAPLASPGEADLTAHVDFAAVARAAERAGAHVSRPVAQAEFLHRLGIAERARMLKVRATPMQAAKIDAALARLTATGTTGMGELFKAIAISDPKLGVLPGFDT